MKLYIKNKTINGKGYRKYPMYLYIEIRYILWKLFSRNEYFMESCTIKNFKIRPWEVKVFYVARVIYLNFLAKSNDFELN